MDVRTRFAPSPTGYLHIGGARTALFNWLFARRHGGQFILRIDDTDDARHVENAIAKILEGFRWLGVDWDEGPEVGGPHAPYFQSQRTALYEKALETLIEAGAAYPCQATAAELDTARTAALAAKKPFVYRGPARDINPSEALDLFRQTRCALRFKVPAGQTTVLQDAVRGNVEWQTDTLGDFTISRSGGQPLYNLASIVDDLDMKITHVIRAEEHLSNTHPQLLIARAMGGAVPVFAHVPFVAAPGGKKKLSKRNPPPGVMVALDEYEQVGYLPEGVVNALARLGWSLDDRTEFMTLDQLIANFSLERITSAAAALDPDKIYWLQDQHMRHLSPDERVARMIPFLQRENLLPNPPSAEQLATLHRIDAAAGDRLKLLSDIVRYGGFFFRDQVLFERKALKNLEGENSPQILADLESSLATLDRFEPDSIEAQVKAVADKWAIGGKIAHLLRAALTGQAVGPGVYECAAILGKDRSLARLHSARLALVDGTLTAAV